MTLRTKLDGSVIQSGSIAVTSISNFAGELSASLPTGVLSSSAQVVNALPTDTVSSSVQVTAFLPTNTVSSSGQVTAFLPTNTVSSSTQVTAFLPVGTVSSSGQVDFASISNKPTLVSSSGQVDVFNTVGGNTIATTGSNTFTGVTAFSDTTNSTNYLNGAVTVAGGLSVQKDVRISGSMTINGLLTVVSMSSQYVTSSQYNIGVSKVTVNDDDNVRFAGLSVVDSGSSSPATASIFWDSLQHRFLYENLSGSAYNSAILIAGPKNTGSLGSESGLTSGYLPYATGEDHIDNSVMYQNGSNIGVGITNPLATFQVQGNVSASSFTGSLSGTVATAAQTNITSLGTLSSLTVAGAVSIATGVASQLAVFGANNTTDKYLTIKNSSGDLYLGSTGTSTYLWNVANTPLTFYTNNSLKMTLDQSGSLGIGVTPRANTRLDVVSDATNQQYIDVLRLETSDSGDKWPAIQFVGNRGGNAKYCKISIDGGSGTNEGRLVYFSEAGHNWYTGNGTSASGATQRMAIDSSGTTTITGPNVGNTSLIVRNANSVNSGEILLGGTTYGTKITRDSLGADQDLIFVNSHGGAQGFKFRTGTTTAGTTELLMITGTGNVGIGTTNPRGRLSIGTADLNNGATDASTGINLKQSSNTADTGIYLERSGERRGYSIYIGGALDALTFQRNEAGTKSDVMSLTRDGNVGINESSPTTRLHVKGANTAARGQLTVVGDGDDARISLYRDSTFHVGISAGSSDSYIGTESNTPFRLLTNGSEKVRIAAAGNVGIGITTPSMKLSLGSDVGRKFMVYDDGGGANEIGGGMGVDLGGFSAETSIFFGNYGGNGRLSIGAWTSSQTYSTKITVLANGNVGIGTTNPGSSRLYVDGNVSIPNGILGVANARIGSKNTSVSTSATTITTIGLDFGQLVIVSGVDSVFNIFTDLIFTSTTAGPTVISAKSISGSPAARTYSMSSTFLQLAMASGTWTIYTAQYTGV